MTHTPVTFVKDLTEHPFLTYEGTEHRLYVTEDGTLVVTSYAPPDSEYAEHTLAWVAVDETGVPDVEYIASHATADDYPHVDGPANHLAALEQHGFTLASEDANA